MNFMSAKKLYIYLNLRRCLEECSPYTQCEREGLGHQIVRRGEQCVLLTRDLARTCPHINAWEKIPNSWPSTFSLLTTQTKKNLKNWKSASENRKGFLLKGELEGLERWIRDQEHLLLLQETHAQLPAPAWQPTTTWNFSPRDLMPSSGLLEHKAYTWYGDIHVSKTPIHIK